MPGDGSTFSSFSLAFVWTLGLLFDFWPLILLGALRGAIEGRGSVLRAMAGLSILWGLLRIVLALVPEASGATTGLNIIPEPLNTSAFVLVAGGTLVVWLVWERMKLSALRRSMRKAASLNAMLALSPLEFEAMVGELYRQAGHTVFAMKKTGDHGIDLVIRAANGETWVVQCKRWRAGTVGEPVLRDLYGAMQHAKADRAILVTTGRFSAAAQRWAKGKPITLLDGDQLVALGRRVHAQHTEVTLFARRPVQAKP